MPSDKINKLQAVLSFHNPFEFVSEKRNRFEMGWFVSQPLKQSRVTMNENDASRSFAKSK